MYQITISAGNGHFVEQIEDSELVSGNFGYWLRGFYRAFAAYDAKAAARGNIWFRIKYLDETGRPMNKLKHAPAVSVPAPVKSNLKSEKQLLEEFDAAIDEIEDVIDA